MLNKKSLRNRILVGIGIAATMLGMVALDIFFVNSSANGRENGFISGRAINSVIISVFILLSVIEMRRALGRERIPDSFSWMLWLYGIGLGPSYSLFGFTGIVFFTLMIFAVAAVTALYINRADSIMYIAFMLVYPGLFMAALLYINRCAATYTVSDSLMPYVETDIWSRFNNSRITYLLPFNAIGLAFVFGVSSLTDVFAYFVGSIFGKHKLCPQISPKKTVEGAIGGLVGGLVGSALIYLVFDLFAEQLFGRQFDLTQNLSVFNKFLTYSVLGLFGSVMTQIGDLFASLIKRACGIKDYSHILGEHGGIMDRFDGMMFNAVFVAVVYTFII